MLSVKTLFPENLNCNVRVKSALLMCGLSAQAAAVEQLEESKSKIEGLLDWISNVGNKNKSSLDQTDHVSQENGNLPEEPSAKGLITDDDNANGNALQATEKDFGRETRGEDNESPNLDKQYQGLKV